MRKKRTLLFQRLANSIKNDAGEVIQDTVVTLPSGSWLNPRRRLINGMKRKWVSMTRTEIRKLQKKT